MPKEKTVNHGAIATGARIAFQAIKAASAARGKGKAAAKPIDAYFKKGAKLDTRRGSRTGVAVGRKKKRSGRSYTGPYVGPIRKGKRLSKKYDKFLTRGFTTAHEMNGTVSDPDVTYVGVSALAGYATIELIAQTLLRKLFEKAGVVVTSIDQPLTAVLVVAGTGQTTVVGEGQFGWRLAYRTVNQKTRAVTWLSYDLVNGDTIGTITGKVLNPGGALTANWSQWISDLRAYSSGGGVVSADNVDEPDTLQLLKHDAFGVLPTEILFRMVATLNLREEYVVCHTKTTLKIQNRSLSASANPDAEAVDSNPCRLVKYQFFGCPRTRTIDYNLAPTVANNFPPPDAIDGAIAIRGGSLEGNLREPPNPKYFWNCQKYSTDVLNPGEIRSDSFSFFKKQRFHVFMRSLRHSTSASGAEEQTINAPFRLYCLEDMINVNAAQNIAMAYEVQRDTKMYMMTSKVRGSVQQRYATNPSTL